MRITLTGANGFIGKILKKELEEIGHTVIPVRTDEDYIPENIDCLIHCARAHKNLIEPITEDKWIGEFTTDIMLPYFYTMEMIEVNPGLDNIIFISSIYGIKVPTVRPIPVNYLVSKAAEIYLSKILAVNLAPKIRVNCVILGGVESDREIAQQTPEFREKYSAKTLLGHMVLPDEVAGAVRFLVSEESKGMTGSALRVDGGYGIT
jgi:NAD(P)-dependent dehydrogenase (short-subunit alcohol dehydrogenase family)